MKGAIILIFVLLATASPTGQSASKSRHALNSHSWRLTRVTVRSGELNFFKLWSEPCLLIPNSFSKEKLCKVLGATVITFYFNVGILFFDIFVRRKRWQIELVFRYIKNERH